MQGNGRQSEPLQTAFLLSVKCYTEAEIYCNVRLWVFENQLQAFTVLFSRI